MQKVKCRMKKVAAGLKVRVADFDFWVLDRSGRQKQCRRFALPTQSKTRVFGGWCEVSGYQTSGHTTKCPLRGQTTSQRDIVHLALVPRFGRGLSSRPPARNRPRSWRTATNAGATAAQQPSNPIESHQITHSLNSFFHGLKPVRPKISGDLRRLPKHPWPICDGRQGVTQKTRKGQ
jgi:hypothetical protein